MNSIKNSIQMKKVLIFEDLLFPCANITVTSIENGRQKIIKATIVHIIRECITVEAYVSIRNRNPPLYTGPIMRKKKRNSW